MSEQPSAALTELRSLAEKATPGPWRKRREALDRDQPDAGPERWKIVAGYERWHRNMGHFHPEDAMYPQDEHHVVAFGYDRDYGYAEGGIANERDAAYIAAVSPDVVLAMLEAVEKAQAVDDVFNGLAMDENDGEFALWSQDDLIGAIFAMRKALQTFSRARSAPPALPVSDVGEQ